MKKEVLVKPRDKDFLEFLKEKLEGKVAWIYIDKATIVNLSEKLDSVSYRDTNSKLYIPYGNIVVDGYNEKYEWNRIYSIESSAISYMFPSNPDEIIFVTVKE